MEQTNLSLNITSKNLIYDSNQESTFLSRVNKKSIIVAQNEAQHHIFDGEKVTQSSSNPSTY